MKRAEEATFDQNRWHSGVFEYIKVLTTTGAAASIDDVGKIFHARRSESSALLGVFVEPDLRPAWPCPHYFVIWDTIQVDGEEYVCVGGIRDACASGEHNCHVCITCQGDGNITAQVVVDDFAEFEYNIERQLFLAVSEPNRSGIGAAVARVKTNLH